MKGYIYIAGAFQTVNLSTCGQIGSPVDNDPHFWTTPPTWGICRPDLRASAEPGDFVFFVLPKRARHPQMIFGYLKVAANIPHSDAFARTDLRSKRMREGVPNGNIIVDEESRYNRFDKGVHQSRFEKIKRHYVVGCETDWRFLTDLRIRQLASTFVETLGSVVGKSGSSAFEIISRRGLSNLTEGQVNRLRRWLDSA